MKYRVSPWAACTSYPNELTLKEGPTALYPGDPTVTRDPSDDIATVLPKPGKVFSEESQLPRLFLKSTLFPLMSDPTCVTPLLQLPSGVHFSMRI